MSKQIPEKGRLMTCPACGKTVPNRDIFTGKHQRNDCEPFQKALDDAQPGSFQEKRKAELRQERLVVRGTTFSERYADFVLQSDFVRKWWIPSWLTTMLLSWLVGYQTPNFNYWVTMISIPAIAFLCLLLFFNGKARSLFRKGPVKRV